jgi:hypothetical protein
MNLRDDWDYILKKAQERYSKVRTQWHVNRYGNRLEIMGAAGEVAARRLLRLERDLHVGFDGGIDFMWRGKKVDVKATRKYPHVECTALQWPLTRQINADLIILVLVDAENKEADIVGYITKAELENARTNLSASIPCLEVPTTKFHCIYELLDNERYPIPA